MDVYKIPDFLNKDEQDYMEIALDAAPEGVDTSEGQMYHDHTMPTAIIASEVTNRRLVVALKQMFPHTATGEFLEGHGYPYGIYRRSATHATTTVKIESKKEGMEIPRGLLVYTLGDEVEDAKTFRTTENIRIENGGAYVKVEAVEAGIDGNVPANTIVAAQRGYEVDSVTNPEPATGGTPEESDESLRARILERYGKTPLSGARRDYERWAKEVDGVGGVIVQPLWAGPQTVRVLITDSNNEPASDELIKRVKDYIDPEEFEGLGEGVAPIGAIVTVDTIKLIAITVSLSLKVSGGHDAEVVKNSITHNINNYLASVDYIQYARIGEIIINTTGVYDYADLLVNNDTQNIAMPEGNRAYVEEVMVND